MFSRQLPFWLFTFALIAALTLPVLIQDGMFMDAVLYTSVSKNLANGTGSFWFPVFSNYGVAGLSTFHEQPPLVFGIQALFFYVFGSSMYTERIYVLVTIIASALFIVRCWQQAAEGAQKAIGWLPLILWIIIPVCFWSYSNNMHENTVTVFTLLSCIYYLMSVNRSSTLPLVISGLFIFLASFSKGIPGFFTLAMPFIYWVCTRRITFGKAIGQTIILAIIPAIIYVLLFQLEAGRESLSNYFYKRLLHRISDVHTVESRFYIIYRLLLELIPSAVITFIILIISRWKIRYSPSRSTVLLAAFFVLLGVSGSLPLMLTKVQKGFYFVPSLPFFAIGLGLLAAGPVGKWADQYMSTRRRKTFTVISSLVLCGVLVFTATRAGKTGRERDVLHDIHLIGKKLEGEKAVGIPEAMWNDWSLQCYMMRYYSISLDPSGKAEYFVIDRETPHEPPQGFAKMELDTRRYDVYRKGP